MKGIAIAAIVVCIIAAAGACIVIAVQGGNNHSSDSTYSISYELDGGTGDDLPDRYTYGTITELGCPSKTYMDSKGEEQEYYFLGWFTDREYKNNIMYIPKDMKGDMTLYAKWGKDVVGSGFIYDFETVTEQTVFYHKYTTITEGTYQYAYLYYDADKGYYLNKIMTTYTLTGTPVVSGTSNWSEDDEVEPKDIVENTILELDDRKIDTTKVILEYDGITEIQYLIYGWVPVKIEASYFISSGTSSSDVSSTYVLNELYSNEFKDSYTISVYTESGITVTGDGEHARGEKITITASADVGYEFEGWYDGGGNLVDENETFTVDVLLSDITLYARNTSTESDVVVEVGDSHTFSDGTLSDVKWMLYDSDNAVISADEGNSFTYTFKDYGRYTLISSGHDDNKKTVNKIISIVSDGYCSKTFEWKYSGVTYTYTLNILYSDYNDYLSDKDVTREQTSDDSDMRELITYDDKYVKELADYIKGQTKGMSDMQKVNVLLKFTQYIEYKTDTETKGLSEYWKYPLETLFEQNGDCEDTSILFCAIGKAMGYDTALMLFSGHATGGINITDVGYTVSQVCDIEQKQIFYTSYSYSSYSYYIPDGNKKISVYYEDEHEKKDTGGRFYFYCETTSTGYKVMDIPSTSYDYRNVQNVIPTTASST